MKTLQILSFCLLVATAVLAQDPAPAAAPAAPVNPLTAHNKFVYGVAQKLLLRSAEVMPEENYSFKPTDAVRTFGQIVGHTADSQYIYCSMILGEKRPNPQNEKTKTTKAELIAALKESGAYCERAYDGLTDLSGVQMVKLGRDMPKLGVLTINTIHLTEHYGNLVTYMRMKNLVPPTSDPEFMQQFRK